jgi:hypothetical protein
MTEQQCGFAGPAAEEGLAVKRAGSGGSTTPPRQPRSATWSTSNGTTEAPGCLTRWASRPQLLRTTLPYHLKALSCQCGKGLRRSGTPNGQSSVWNRARKCRTPPEPTIKSAVGMYGSSTSQLRFPFE